MGAETSKCGCKCDHEPESDLQVSNQRSPTESPGVPTGNIPAMNEAFEEPKYTMQAAATVPDKSGGNLAPATTEEPTVEPTLEEFQVVIHKEGKRLGIDIDLSDGKTLLIENVGDGLIAEWNKGQESTLGSKKLEVQAYDRIIAVNGKTGDSQQLADRCVNDDRLELKIRRAPMTVS